MGAIKDQRQPFLTALAHLGMTQSEFANLIDFCHPTVYRWGVSRPIPRVIWLLLASLVETRRLRSALARATGQGPPGFMGPDDPTAK